MVRDAPTLFGRAKRILTTEGPLELARRGTRFAHEYAKAARVGRAVRRESAAVATIPDALRFQDEFSYDGVSIKAVQDPVEIEALLHILERDAPKTIVEIGTARGGTLFLFARAAAPDAFLLGVDWGISVARAPLYRALAREGQRVELLEGDSHDASMVSNARTLLAGRPVDFLFVDGDHTYEGVRADFELWTPLVRQGGLVALHDIHSVGEEFGVGAFWQELTSRYETEELVGRGGVMGIGVVRIP
jgi:cephalosporin hydroxylase